MWKTNSKPAVKSTGSLLCLKKHTWTCLKRFYCFICLQCCRI